MNTSKSLVTEDLIDVDLLFTRVEVEAIHFGSPSGTGGDYLHYCGMLAVLTDVRLQLAVTRGPGMPVMAIMPETLLTLLIFAKNVMKQTGMKT
jgi:hypothetical protein